jgi:AMMECR1 domain-containing protein
MLSLPEGKILVKLARETVERRFRLGKFYVKRVEEKFEEKR